MIIILWGGVLNCVIIFLYLCRGKKQKIYLEKYRIPFLICLSIKYEGNKASARAI